MPPAALVSSSVLIAEPAEHADGERHGRAGRAPRRSARGPTSASTALARDRPATSRPAWPITVRRRPVRNVVVVESNGSASRVGERAEPGAEHDGDVGGSPQPRPREQVGRLVDPIEVMSVMRLDATAESPAITRTRNSRACRPPSRGCRGARGRAAASGTSAPMPPIWMPIEEKFAKPHSANVAMVNDRGSSDVLQRPELREGDELVEHHPRAEQVADRRGVPPRHAQAPGDRREHPAEDPAARPGPTAADPWPRMALTSAISATKRDEHRADVEREVQALAGAAAGRVDHVDVGLLDVELDRPERLRHRRSPARTSWPSSACRARS